MTARGIPSQPGIPRHLPDGRIAALAACRNFTRNQGRDMRNTAFGFGTPLLCFLLLALGIALFSDTARGEERIPITFPPLTTHTMPPVFFTHDRHVEYMERSNAECTLCHRETDEGMSETFLDVKDQPEHRQIPYLHATCTACHRKAGAGPRLVDCRVCHSKAVAAQSGKSNEGE